VYLDMPIEQLVRNEEGLAPPVEILRDAYGAKLEIREPKVRLIGGVQVKEPIMRSHQPGVALPRRVREGHARPLTRDPGGNAA
jgi:hypothetical protein